MRSPEHQKKTRRLAVSAMLSALGVVVMYLGSLIEVFDLTSVAMASVFILFAVTELGSPYPCLIYGVTSVLSLVLLPSKTAGIVYLLFGGIYPFFKRQAERLPGVAAWLLKFAYFNGMLCFLLWAALGLLRIQDDSLGFNPVTFGICNVACVAYDIALSRLEWLYTVHLRKRFRVERYFH